MPRLSWNEVKNRAIRFSREWSDATSERADKQTFYNEFFEVFGIRRASVASFEANVRNLQGHVGAIDLLWRGKLIVEHKSRGHSLSQAETEAFRYIEDLSREGRFDEVPRFERLPLRASPHIVQANALRADWNTFLPHAQCSYVLGNPPFVGHRRSGITTSQPDAAS